VLSLRSARGSRATRDKNNFGGEGVDRSPKKIIVVLTDHKFVHRDDREGEKNETTSEVRTANHVLR
jgi:hypothetical protein